MVELVGLSRSIVRGISWNSTDVITSNNMSDIGIVSISLVVMGTSSVLVIVGIVLVGW